MQIYSNTPLAINFTSKNNPIKPFFVNTPKGELQIMEFKEMDASSIRKSKSLAKFFLDSFIGNTNDPWFLSLKKDKAKYLNAVERFSDYYRNMFKKDDGNLTMLIARNDKNKLCGAVVTNTLNESGVNDCFTCYVDSLAVSPKYRKCGVGKLLMEKAISKDVYSDSFLASDNMAVPFQLKNGYRALDYSNPNEKKIIDKINADRGDYPEFVTFMYKKLKDNGDITWAERVKIVNE